MRPRRNAAPLLRCSHCDIWSETDPCAWCANGHRLDVASRVVAVAISIGFGLIWALLFWAVSR